MAENNTERTKRKHRSEEKERTERKYRSEEKERIEKRDGTDGMQMGAIDETLLVRRTGGKNKTTQLSRGDPEIVPDKPLKGSHKDSKRPIDHYVDINLRAAFYQALYEIMLAENKGKNPDLKIDVLHNTARLFADVHYKPQLLKAEEGKMNDKRMAEMVNVQAYKAKLEQLRYGYAKEGKVKEQEAVTTLINALNQKKLLRPDKLSTVFTVLGDDVKVTKTQVQPVMSNLQNQGLLAPEDVKEYQTKLSTRQKENVRVENVTKYMTMRVGVKPDYTLAPKADAHSDTPGYISFRPNMTKPMATVDTPETKSKRTQKTSRRPDQSIKVNFDDRTDRTATQIDFRHVGTKIADMKTTMKLN